MVKKRFTADLELSLKNLSDTHRQPFTDFVLDVTKSNDIHPALCALKELEDQGTLKFHGDLWFLIYLAFDHVGTACTVLQHNGSNPWKCALDIAAREHDKPSVRGYRQRGFIGDKAQYAIRALRDIYQLPGTLFENMGSPKTYRECLFALSDIPLLGREAAILLAHRFGVVDYTDYPYFDDIGFIEGMAFTLGKVKGRNKNLSRYDVTAQQIEDLGLSVMLHEHDLIPMVRLYRSYRKKIYSVGRNRRFARQQAGHCASTLSACFAQLCSPRNIANG